MPISRGQMPRQMYGLGSFVKSITKGAKSAVKGITSTFKENPLLGLAALNFAPMLAGAKPFIGMGSLAGSKYTIPGISSIMGSLGLDVAKGAKPTLGQFGKVFAIGSLGGAALEALTASGADEEELGNIRDVDTLRSYLRRGYEQLNPEASPEQINQFVETNTREYAANGGRIGFAEGMPEEGIETLLPKPKPSEMMQGVDKTIQSIDNFAQLIAQSGDPSSFRGHVDLLSEFIQKNDIDPSAAFDYVKRRVDEIKPGLSKFIFTTTEDMPVQKAYGGRIGYRDAGVASDFQKWLEGKQQFDQKRNAEELYKEYLEQKRREKIMEQKTMAANGGRIGFFKGAQADARAGKGAMSPGTRADYKPGQGTRDDNPFTGGGGGPKGPPSIINQPPEPKTIRDRLKEKGIETLKTAQKFNPFNFIFGTPAGAAEFDMEAFKKAGAGKGFFGGMNDELEAMQEYYDAAKSLTAPGAKFAGANNPQAVRDFITKQSEIPFGGGSYNINMSLVPKTFLETQQDFMTQKAPISFFNLGGRAGYAFGSPEQNAMEASGIGGLPLNQNPAGITELDLRDSGGFIPPVGVKEKADDIPAMLSNNEFVFTADAVRGMGDGDVEKGAQRMYDMMKKLENGGRV